MSMTSTEKNEFQKFIIKYTVIATAIAFVLGQELKEFIHILVNTVTDPLFSVDLDENGKPDLKELNYFTTDLLGIKFPFGDLLISSIKIVVSFIVIYYFVQIMIHYTKWVKL